MSKVYAITGGASGIGLAAARCFGKSGTVLIGGRTQSKIDDAVQNLRAEGADIRGMVCDVEDAASVKAFAEEAAKLGTLAAVIHAAGVSPAMGTAEKILRINMQGTINAVEAFIPYIGSGTVMINVASMAGHMLPPNPELFTLFGDPYCDGFIEGCLKFSPDPATAYNVSKNLVAYFTKANAVRFGRKGARVVSISPGVIDTPMVEIESGASIDQIISATPVSRMGKPDELAALIEFLCGDNAGFITGCDILIDGGFIASIQTKPVGMVTV